MAVQWYPGHMHKARKKIKEIMPQVDLVMEVMDARLPFSSENPLVSQLRGDRPCIKILNKSDLADPEVTRQWLSHLEREKGVRAQALTASEPAQIRKLPALCRKLAPQRNTAIKPIRVLIMGIPNVGKSTLINILAGRGIAKVGDEPAVTKNQQRVGLGQGMELVDSPGMLWPRMSDPRSGYRLAVTGAIKNTAMDFDDVALFAADYLLQAYPGLLEKRYKLSALPSAGMALLEAIGRKRGGLRPGGVVDIHKASEVLLNDIRSGALGRISLETPHMEFIQEE